MPRPAERSEVHAPPERKREIAEAIRGVFNALNLEEAERQLDRLIQAYQDTVHSPARTTIQQHADAQGRHYEPRSGAGLFYRYRPRLLEQAYTGEGHGWARWLKRLPELPSWLPQHLGIPRLTPPPRKIPVHVSVRQRLLHDTQKYAPYVLPENVEVAHTRGTSPFAAETNSTPLMLPEADSARKSVLGSVRMRRVAYGFTVLGILVLPVAFWFLPIADLARFCVNPSLDQVLPVLRTVMNNFWLNLTFAFIVPGLLLSRWAQRGIRQRPHEAWRTVLRRTKLLP